MGGESRRAIDERPFHRWLARSLPGRRGLWGPLGDDTATLPLGGGRALHATSDVLVEGTHFLPGSSPERLGRAAAAVNLSDLAAKGAVPVGLLVDLLVPPGTPARWAQGVLRGADACGRAYGAPVVGGDTKPAPVPAVAGVAIGLAPSGRGVPRSGARSGDLIVVSGDVGRGGVAAGRLDRDRRSVRARNALLEIRPRVAEGLEMARYAHAMTDSSDGLAEAVRLLAEASGLRAVVREEEIPWAVPLRSKPTEERRRLGFFGGDYELVAAVPPARMGPARRTLRRLRTPWTVVGRFEHGSGGWLVDAQGRSRALPPAGWRPFGPPRALPA